MPGSFPDLRYFANLTLYHVSHKINEKKMLTVTLDPLNLSC